MKIAKLNISPNKLKTVDPSELFFFIQTTMFLNEIITLEKLIAFAVNANDKENEILRKAHLTQVTFLEKLLAGKLFEGWEMVRRFPLSKNYDSLLSREAKDCLNQIKSYFKKKTNKILQIRNIYAFHYSCKDNGLQKEITKLIKNLPESQPLEIFIGNYECNCLYTLSHSTVNYLMFSNNYGSDLSKAVQNFRLELRQIHKLFVQFAQDVVRIFIEKHNWDRTEMEIPVPIAIHEVSIPYFLTRD